MILRVAAAAAIGLMLCAAGIPQDPEVKAPALVKCAERIVDLPFSGAVASIQNKLLVGTGNGALLAFDHSLSLVWSIELGGEFASNVTGSEKVLAVVMNAASAEGAAPHDSSTLRLVSRENGIPVGTTKLPYAENYYLFTRPDKLVAVSRSGHVLEIRADSGGISKRVETRVAVAAAPSEYAGGDILIPTQDKRLWAYSPSSGELVVRNTLETLPAAITATKDDGYAIGDDRGNLSLYSSEGRRPGWRFKGGAAISSIKWMDDALLVSSLDNFLYLVSDYNGNVIWKRRLNGRVPNSGISILGHYVTLVPSENSVFVIEMEKGLVTDAVIEVEKEIISRSVVAVNGRSFAFVSANSIDLYALGFCPPK